MKINPGIITNLITYMVVMAKGSTRILIKREDIKSVTHSTVSFFHKNFTPIVAAPDTALTFFFFKSEDPSQHQYFFSLSPYSAHAHIHIHTCLADSFLKMCSG